MSAVMDEIAVEFSVEATGRHARPYTFTAPSQVWGDILRHMNEVGDANVRNSLAKDITANYSGTFEDDEEITVTPTRKTAVGTAEAFSQLGLEVDLESIPVPEKPARTPSTREPKEPTYCLFSGLETSGGRFRPGYDMKLRGALTRIVDNIQLDDTDTTEVGTGTATRHLTVAEAIEELVQLGWYSEEELTLRRAKRFKDSADKAENAKIRAAEAARAKAERAAAKAAEQEDSDDEEEDEDEEDEG